MKIPNHAVRSEFYYEVRPQVLIFALTSMGLVTRW